LIHDRYITFYLIQNSLLQTWKLKNMSDLHFAAFVTVKNGRNYNVVNVVDCEIS
jgi:hypothetical protein